SGAKRGPFEGRMSSITVRNDLRGRFGPVRDQGPRPTCVAFAASDAHAATRNPWFELSCEFLFYSVKQHDGTPPENGARMASVRHVLEHVGQPVESAWPYMKMLPRNIRLWKPPARVGKLYTRTSKDAGGEFSQAWEAVMQGNPALIGMTISPGFYQWDRYG